MSVGEFYAGRKEITAVENERKRIKAKWGNLGRVRLMAPPALRERYDRQEARWEAAVQAGALAGLQAEGPRMVRALQAIDLAGVQSQGYCFQVDLAYRAVSAGLRVVEVPITFVERTAGQSKMSGNIVQEAMLMVTKWGVAKRVGQVRRLVGRP